MPLWILGAITNGVIFGAYMGIAYVILSGVWRSGQWLSNPLALATGVIFFTCGVGHGVHLSHLFLPSFGIDVEAGMSARTTLGDWHLWVWDGITAAVAVWYLNLRQRFPALLRGTALFEDLKIRQREALEIHDNIVQGLATAKLSLELGRTAEAMEAVTATLAASRRIITELLGEPGSGIELRAGDLRRRVPAAPGR